LLGERGERREKESIWGVQQLGVGRRKGKEEEIH
jgi:hypothetical protein